jgi:26S proteasome non-ATPase regulatory subunit 9
MVGANVKAETVTMMDKRQSIEAEMDGIISRLCVPNGPGLQGNLVDSEVRYPLHH